MEISSIHPKKSREDPSEVKCNIYRSGRQGKYDKLWGQCTYWGRGSFFRISLSEGYIDSWLSHNLVFWNCDPWLRILAWDRSCEVEWELEMFGCTPTMRASLWKDHLFKGTRGYRNKDERLYLVYLRCRRMNFLRLLSCMVSRDCPVLFSVDVSAPLCRLQIISRHSIQK